MVGQQHPLEKDRTVLEEAVIVTLRGKGSFGKLSGDAKIEPYEIWSITTMSNAMRLLGA